MYFFRDITIYSILRSYAEQNKKKINFSQIDIIWKLYP